MQERSLILCFFFDLLICSLEVPLFYSYYNGSMKCLGYVSYFIHLDD